MDEACPALGERDRDPGAHQPTLTRRQVAVLHDRQIRTRVPGVGIAGDGHLGIKPDQADPNPLRAL